MILSATRGISKVLSIGFMSIFIVITLISIIYSVVENRSLEPIVKDLGGKWLLTTQKLSETSRQIVENGGVVSSSDSLFSKIWAIMKNFGLFFYYIYTIFVWLKILTYIVGRFPGQSIDRKFRNVSIAVFVFIFLQSILVFGNAAIVKEVDCFSGCGGKGVIDYMLTPLTSLVDVWKVLPYIFTPILEFREKTSVNITNFNL
jgi:hypothetical protein